MLKLTVISWLVHFTAGQHVININNFTEAVLLQANTFLTKAGLGVRRLPDESFPHVKLSNGVEIGVNSLNRTADCFLTHYENKTEFIDLHIGLKLLALAYGSIRTDGIDISGLFRVRNNSFHLSYTTDTQPECKVTLGDYQLETFTDVPFESSNPRYDSDMSDIFTRVVLPIVNKRIGYLRGKVEYRLQKLICHEEEVLNVDHSLGLIHTLVHMLT